MGGRATADQINDAVGDIIARHVVEEIKKIAPAYGSINYKRAGSSALANEIIENWPSFDPLAMNFYLDQLDLLSNSGTTWSKSVVNGSVASQQKFLSELAAGNVRVNLKKAQLGTALTIFANTLPFVQVGTNIWFTKRDGSLAKIIVKSSDDLRKMYLNEWMSPSGAYAGSTGDFVLDPVKVATCFINNRSCDATSEDSESNVFKDIFETEDEMVTDLSTSTVYVRDSSGLHRLVDGKKVAVEQFQGRCAGTLLNDEGERCQQFVTSCLLECDPEKLANCLNLLQDSDLFNVAETELHGMDPTAAVKVLATFGVEKTVEGGVVVPQSFGVWKANVLSKFKNGGVKSSILANKNLLNYLQGVIDFARRNPAVFPENKDKVFSRDANVPRVTDSSMSAIGKKFYVSPYPGSQEELIQNSRLLLASVEAPAFGYVPGNMMLASPYNAVVAPAVLGNPLVGMRGGGNSVYEDSVNRKYKRQELSSNMMWVLMNSVKTDLEKSGIKLKDSDWNALEKGIGKLKGFENKFAHIYNMLKILSELSTFFRASGCGPSAPMREISISQVRNNVDMLNYLEKNIGDLQSCLSSNLGDQNTLTNDMVRKFSALLETAGGRRNSEVVDA